LTFQRIAAQADVPVGEVRVFDLAGVSIALANVGGRFYAVDNVCTHDGGPLGEGALFDGQVECPRHGARFDLSSGRVVVLPAVRPVRIHAVKVDGEDVKVDLDV